MTNPGTQVTLSGLPSTSLQETEHMQFARGIDILLDTAEASLRKDSNDSQETGSNRAQSLVDLQIASFESIIDTIISQGRSRVVAKKRERNSHSSICQLPNEILSHILELLVEIYYKSGISNEALHCARDISQVSHHFRDVALATPRLWGYMESTHEKSTNLILLERSKNAPLYVTVRPALGYRPAAYDPRKFVEHLSAQIHRFKSLHHHASAIDMLEISRLFLTTPAPELEVLVVEPTHHMLFLPESTQMDYGIMSDLFAGQAPKLKTLRLTLLSIPWNSSMFGLNLTSLHLDSQPRSRWPTLDCFLDILRKCSNLEEIALFDFGILDPLASPAVTVARLPHLCSLSIRSVDPGVTGVILGIIEMDNFSTANISIDLKLSPEQSLKTVLPHTFELSLSNMLTSTFDTFDFIAYKSIITLSTRDKSQQLDLVTGDIQSIVSEQNYVSFPNVSTVRIQELELEDHEPTAIKILARLSNQIIRLELINNRSVDSVLGFIFEPVVKGDNKMGRQWHVPLVKAIVLADCWLNPEKLAARVAKRCKYPKKGRKQRPKVADFSLTLEDCSMTQTAFDSMSKCMVKGGLKWDGKTVSLIELEDDEDEEEYDEDEDSEDNDYFGQEFYGDEDDSWDYHPW